MTKNKAKILYLSQVFPYPPDGGGKIKTLNTVKTLAEKFEVHAVFISENKPSAQNLTYVKNLGLASLKVFYNPLILESVKDNYPKLIKNFLRFNSHYVFQYTLPVAFPYIRKAIENLKPDVIHVDHLNMAQYLPKQKKQIWILESHNIEYQLLWSRFKNSLTIKRKLYLLLESCFTYLFERRWVKRFDHIFTISQLDNERYVSSFGLTNVTTQSLYYPRQKIRNFKKVASNHILFIGNLGWPPNEDAIERCLLSIFPLVLKSNPRAELHIVGKNHPRLLELYRHMPGVFFHGYQDNLDKFLEQASIFILPFWMGGGVRLKALTALSQGIPIVSTNVGVEGLLVKPSHEYIQANTYHTFAQAITKLLNSQKLQKKLSQASLLYCQEHHGEKVNDDFLEVYKKVIAKKPRFI